MRKWTWLGVLVCWLVWSVGVKGAQPGDLNRDGVVNAADAVTLQNYLAGNIGSLFENWLETDPIVGDLMVVPAGTFTQGSPAGEPCRVPAYETQFTHTLTRNRLVMATEVTRRMWVDLKALQPTLPGRRPSRDGALSGASGGLRRRRRAAVFETLFLLAHP